MVAISDSLTWELTKKNTSFMRKKNGRTKRSGSVKFSVEKGNAKNLSLFKYSGIANSKAVDVVFTDGNGAALVTKTASKAGAQPAKTLAETPMNKHFRRAEKSIKSQAFDNFYRPDLQEAVLAKYTKVYSANRIAKGVKKALPMKQGRKKN
mmetsp:Transcript_8816/g.12563  ORF Transcript_8816/g.12563 Transcript_8816/m.12563 type:complete len:151 (-) Transcript_8816:47-499(-)